jgi:hypothetical protein
MVLYILLYMLALHVGLSMKCASSNTCMQLCMGYTLALHASHVSHQLTNEPCIDISNQTPWVFADSCFASGGLLGVGGGEGRGRGRKPGLNEFLMETRVNSTDELRTPNLMILPMIILIPPLIVRMDPPGRSSRPRFCQPLVLVCKQARLVSVEILHIIQDACSVWAVPVRKQKGSTVCKGCLNRADKTTMGLQLVHVPLKCTTLGFHVAQQGVCYLGCTRGGFFSWLAQEGELCTEHKGGPFFLLHKGAPPLVPHQVSFLGRSSRTHPIAVHNRRQQESLSHI